MPLELPLVGIFTGWVVHRSPGLLRLLVPRSRRLDPKTPPSNRVKDSRGKEPPPSAKHYQEEGEERRTGPPITRVPVESPPLAPGFKGGWSSLGLQLC